MPRRTEITEIYVATFNRAPDADGLDYWENTTFSIDDIAESFFFQTETQEKYPDELSYAEFVNTIYQNLFNRDAEPDGLAYWVGALESGSITRAQMILSVVRGAQGEDADILSNKTEIGLAFADAGLDNYFNSIDIMADIDGTQQSVDDALAQIEIWEETENTIDYTLEEDNIQGTTGDDHLAGILNVTASADLSTFQTIDTADGRDGVDTVTVQNISSVVGNTVVTMVNIEILDLQESGTAGANLRMENVTGLEKIIYSENNAATGVITGLNNIVDLEYNSDDANAGSITINYKDDAVAGDEDEMNIAVNTSSLTAVDTIITNGIEIVNIEVVGDSNLKFNDASAKTILISGNATLKLSGAAGIATVIDASTNTAGVIIDGSIVSASGAVMTGSVAIDNINGGVGVDNITGCLGADILAGGALADRFIYNDHLDSNAATMDKITDFSGSNGDGDKIVVTKAANGTGEALDQNEFIAGVNLALTDGDEMNERGVFNKTTGYLYIDANNDGVYNTDFDVVIHLDSVDDLIAADIII